MTENLIKSHDKRYQLLIVREHTKRIRSVPCQGLSTAKARLRPYSLAPKHHTVLKPQNNLILNPIHSSILGCSTMQISTMLWVDIKSHQFRWNDSLESIHSLVVCRFSHSFFKSYYILLVTSAIMLWQNLFLSTFIIPTLGAPVLESRQTAVVDCTPSAKTGLQPQCWKQCT